jgi:hypothetical protein
LIIVGGSFAEDKKPASQSGNRPALYEKEKKYLDLISAIHLAF